MKDKHKWYRIEMTATGQVYLREISEPGNDLPVGSFQLPRTFADTAENVGRITCSCRLVTL